MILSRNKFLGRKITEFVFSFVFFFLFFFGRSENSALAAKEHAQDVLEEYYSPSWKTNKKEDILAKFGAIGLICYLIGICAVLGYILFLNVFGIDGGFSFKDGGIGYLIVVFFTFAFMSIASYSGIIYFLVYRAFDKAEKAGRDTVIPSRVMFPSLVGYVWWTIITSSALFLFGSIL